MKVLIIETSYPKDFFEERLDGVATSQLLKILRIEAEIRFALDLEHFKKAFADAARGSSDVVHIACHGSESGLSLTDNTKVTWADLADILEDHRYAPRGLVLSSCCGGSSGVERAFERKTYRPGIIFGSTDNRSYDDYLVAWSILYRRFKRRSMQSDDAQHALEHICAVVHPAFIYRRWDEERRNYRHYPGEDERYVVRQEKDHT